MSPTEASPVTNVGHIGEAVVETPFNYDYGYNITIGNYESIGRTCTTNDVARVIISNNSVIGHNVSIFTASFSVDPKKRGGGHGPQPGKGVIIRHNCRIRGGVIRAGRTIGEEVPLRKAQS